MHADKSVSPIYYRHLVFGWGMILLFLLLGIVLEGLHAFKSPWYLQSGHEVRRSMLTLAHTHGGLFGLLNLALAFTVRLTPTLNLSKVGLSSRLMQAASCLLPGGFLLGGLQVVGSDPGPGIWAVPVGAACLVVSVSGIIRQCVSCKPSEGDG